LLATTVRVLVCAGLIVPGLALIATVGAAVGTGSGDGEDSLPDEPGEPAQPTRTPIQRLTTTEDRNLRIKQLFMFVFRPKVKSCFWAL
jgi:hypothetical protein